MRPIVIDSSSVVWRSVCRSVTLVSPAKTAEPIEMPFVDSGGPKEARVQSYSLDGSSMQNFNRIRQVAPMCRHGRAHWRYLANTIEPSVCGGDVVLCQITSTACYYYTPFTRYNRLSNRLYNWFDNRLDNRLYRVNGALQISVLCVHVLMRHVSIPSAVCLFQLLVPLNKVD